jgi:hypothetical protein
VRFARSTIVKRVMLCRSAAHHLMHRQHHAAPPDVLSHCVSLRCLSELSTCRLSAPGPQHLPAPSPGHKCPPRTSLPLPSTSPSARVAPAPSPLAVPRRPRPPQRAPPGPASPKAAAPAPSGIAACSASRRRGGTARRARSRTPPLAGRRATSLCPSRVFGWRRFQ